MCKLCDAGLQLDHSGSRRKFLKVSTAAAVASTGLGLFAPRTARADDDDKPDDSGAPGRRYLIRGGAVMSLSLIHI